MDAVPAPPVHVDRTKDVYWEDIRPRSETIIRDALHPADDFLCELARAAVEEEWTQATVRRMFSLFKHRYLASATVDLPGYTAFLARLKMYLPPSVNRHEEVKLDVDGHSYTMFTWDPLVELGKVIEQGDLGPECHWRYEEIMNEAGERVYGEAWTCDRFKGAQAGVCMISSWLSFWVCAELQTLFPGQDVLALRAYTDKTRVGTFRGHTLYPLVLEVLNLPGLLRRQQRTRVLAALLPVPASHFPPAARDTDAFREHQARVTWEAIRRALAPLGLTDHCHVRLHVPIGQEQHAYV